MSQEDGNALLGASDDAAAVVAADVEAWKSAQDGAAPAVTTSGQDESKGAELPAAAVAQIRSEAARGARDELARLMGDNMKYATDEAARLQLVQRAFFAVTVEVQLSGFVKHLFTSAWVEILLMVLALMFYFGDTKSSTAHFVFIFVLHIVRAPAVLWVLNRIPRVNSVALVMAESNRSLAEERDLMVARLHDLKEPIIGLAIFTGVCAILDVLAVFIRLWDFKDLPTQEIAPSVLLLLLALAFCSIDFSAVMWYFSLKYNLPSEAVDAVTRRAISTTRNVGAHFAQSFAPLVAGDTHAGRAGNSNNLRTSLTDEPSAV